ncbi:fumarate hydratase C-terminal domain-containing protein [Psychrobacillus sp. NPDC096389]|uniref:fumarate hydratase C-terminal domain-containing protein n=1 Tax=Psychrobacillus sp. NPDC096389 TaxID=3364490 RepID=UPI0038295D6B
MELQIPNPLLDVTMLNPGDLLELTGKIYVGRDAVLPKIVELSRGNGLEQMKIDLQGSVIFHSAVSVAGIGPTTSNKVEIEESIVPLSKAGVKIHLGKGEIMPETIKRLKGENAIFAVIPPVTALIKSKVIKVKMVAFPELGMEAFHEITVQKLPCMVAAVNGVSIYKER